MGARRARVGGRKKTSRALCRGVNTTAVWLVSSACSLRPVSSSPWRLTPGSPSASASAEPTNQPNGTDARSSCACSLSGRTSSEAATVAGEDPPSFSDMHERVRRAKHRLVKFPSQGCVGTRPVHHQPIPSSTVKAVCLQPTSQLSLGGPRRPRGRATGQMLTLQTCLPACRHAASERRTVSALARSPLGKC